MEDVGRIYGYSRMYTPLGLNLSNGPCGMSLGMTLAGRSFTDRAAIHGDQQVRSETESESESNVHELEICSDAIAKASLKPRPGCYPKIKPKPLMLCMLQQQVILAKGALSIQQPRLDRLANCRLNYY